jgi:hypothetical protein
MMAQPVNLALRWLKLEDCELEYSLGYTVKLSQKKKTKINQPKEQRRMSTVCE